METEITDIGKVAITPRKDYKNEQTYEWLDVVTYNGASYMCISEDGCTGIVPTNTGYWQLLADKGHFTEEDKEEFKKAVVEESKTEINEHTGNKKTELNNYTTELEKSLENELDKYKTEKEAEMDLHKATLETEMANKKDSLIEEIETAQNGFDANVEEKTNTFNSNLEAKTTEFNNNSNAKTEEFNNNSTEKINAFNSNAEEKIANYNEHVETLTSRIADLEEETDDLFNALDTEKASGTELYIEDAKPCRVINAGINGMYKQETTTGANIMNLNVAQNSKVTVNEDGTVTINGTGGFNLAFESFTFKANTPYYIKWEIVSGTVIKTDNIVIRTPDNSAWALKDEFTSFSVAEDKTIRYAWIHKDAKFENAKIRIWISESQSDFEPYTGKIPSPNPDYPQAIEQVENVKLNINNKNLFNKNIGIVYGKHYSLENGELEDYASDWYQENYINAKPNTTYSISVDGNITGWLRALEYDANKNFLVGHNSYKFTTDSRCRYLRLSAGKSKLEKLQLEIGEIITEYSEYDLFLINIDLKGNKLCAASDTVKDKLLIDRNGNVALQKDVITFLLNGINPHEAKYWSADTIYDLGNGYSHFYLHSNYPGVYQNKSTEKFTYVIADKLVTGQNILNTECINNSSQLHIQILTSRLETNDAEGFKKWLTNNNIKVYAKSSAPELIDLGQLTELPKTFEGINNIWAETNLGNTQIEIEYVQNVKKLLEKQAEQQNARLDNIEALLSTTETSALLLDNMQTDLEKEVE